MKRALGVVILLVVGLSPVAGLAHSDGTSCDQHSGGLVPLVANNEPVSSVLHCHNSDGTNPGGYGYHGAIYVQAPGVAYAGLCADTEQPLPEGYRLSAFYGTGDATAEAMTAQGCDPA